MEQLVTMHPYATDSGERKYVTFLLAIISILSAWLLNEVLLNDLLGLASFWWLEAPSVFGFYGLFYIIFDKYLWQVSILHRAGLVKVPDLNGAWKGCILSSLDHHEAEKDATIKIRQSWTQISIDLKTHNSRSRSLTATVLTEDQNGIVISYEYLNEPRYSAKTTMHIHQGACRFTLSSDRQKLEGEYYTGRDRQTYGILSFKKLSNGSYTNADEVNR